MKSCCDRITVKECPVQFRMRTRILCTALLSLLAVLPMPVSAFAAPAIDYFKMLSVKPNVTSYQLA